MAQTPRSKMLIWAVILGLAAGFLAYAYLKKQQGQAKAPVTVVFAKTTIPSGSIVEPYMVETKTMPRTEVASGTYLSSEAVVGKVTTKNIQPGENISKENVSQKYRLSHTVEPYMRAVTIAVDPVTGVAGFLEAGDRVDVISTFKLNDGSITKTVLQDVKLLAIGAKVVEEESEEARRGQKAKQSIQTTATLAVMPFDAEKLVLADTRGKIRLSLRRADDKSTISAQGVTGRALMGNVPADSPRDESTARTTTVSERPYPASAPVPLFQQQTQPMAVRPAGEKTIQVIRGTDIEDVAVPK